jgi:ABC-type polysaccharide/polyol phosphate export permease
VLVSLVDSIVASLVLVAMLAYYGVMPGASILLLPVVILVHLFFTLACALLLSMGNLFYRDVKYLFEVAIQLWMFATSVLYPVALVGGKTATFMQLNPMTPIIDAYRDVIIMNRAPDPVAFGSVAAVSVVAFLAAWLLFHRAEFQFAENV